MRTSPESSPEEFDPNSLSRADLARTVEVARKTLFRTPHGVIDINDNQTTINETEEGYYILWGNTPGISTYADNVQFRRGIRYYESHAAAMNSLMEACVKHGYTVREEE